MKAVKENKVYTITDDEKERYGAMGYDILDDSGKMIEEAHGKSISYDKYLELKRENDKLKADNAKLKKKAKESDSPATADESAPAGDK